jgi:hypothetical protein
MKERIKIFSKDFLDELQDRQGSKFYLDQAMESGLSFHDAILEVCKKYGLEPEYHDKSKHVNPPFNLEYLYRIRDEELNK